LRLSPLFPGFEVRMGARSCEKKIRAKNMQILPCFWSEGKKQTSLPLKCNVLPINYLDIARSLDFRRFLLASNVLSRFPFMLKQPTGFQLTTQPMTSLDQTTFATSRLIFGGIQK
jgi:hypothetical protein